MKKHIFLKYSSIILKNKKKILSLFMIIWTLFSCTTLNLVDFEHKVSKDKVTPIHPKTHNGGIFLDSPENSTYYEPMSGYYPGTYGFESDLNDEWKDNSEGGSFIKVVSGVSNHKKVLTLNDSTGTGYAFAENIWSNWGPQSFGTVEFWFMTTNVYHLNQITLSYGTTSRFRLRIKDGEWYYTSSYAIVPGLDDEIEPKSNTWYHLRIDFETTLGGYCDLDQYRCRLTINNKYVSGQMNFDTNGELSRLWFLTSGDTGHQDYSIFIDAIGYSFDSEYSIGDNQNEGLLINFDSAHDFGSIVYSLDNMANKTIAGNHTIPMPSNGLHSVQIFGTYLSNIYSSEFRYFTINLPFDIITPRNITYSAPMPGYYVSTYGFDDEDVGEFGENIEFIDYYNNPLGVELYVTGFIGEHKNVLDLYDHSATNIIDFNHQFDIDHTSGTIEWWWRLSDASKGVGIGLRHATSFGPRIDMNGGNLRYFDSVSSTYKAIMTVISGIWYHMRIDFECGSGGYTGLSADNYRLTVGGTSTFIFSFDDPLDHLDNLRVWTSAASYSYHAYLDAFGFSWDSDYNIGDNQFEGFFLEYTKNFETNWIKCSLDGASNKTIGNKYLLPLSGIPANEGHHTVQVFANDTLGSIHQTEIRHFHYYDGAAIPRKPQNFKANDGINHTYLTWDAPSEFNAPILKYNIYRGDQNSKSLLNSTRDEFFNDTDAINYIDQRFYYYVTTVNIVGESEPSNEDFATARNAPNVEWKDPKEGERVIFPPGSIDTFTFEYTFVSLDNVKLFLDNIDYGSVYNSSSVQFVYNDLMEGNINATLIGYQYGIPITQHSINLIFGKLDLEVLEMLDSGTEFIGDTLYLILHDPVGDNSYSSFSKSTSLCTKVSASFTSEEGIDIGINEDLFAIGPSGSVNLQWKQSTENSVTYRMSETNKMTSNLESSDKDFIGPGYGDIYWGEAQVLNYEFKAYYREYYNGTKIYQEPKLFWGILRNSEVFLNDMNAPEDWKMQNPVHNGWNDVNWDWQGNVYRTYMGGTEHSYVRENVTTISRSTTVDFSIDSSVSNEFFDVLNVELSLVLTWENFEENEEETKYEVAYTIYDDDPNDILCQKVGLDKKFGTAVFKPNPDISRSSNPLEYNSSDYIAPIIDFPSIEYDTNNDGLGPCSDDTPEIIIAISDEGGVQAVAATYSINNEISAHTVILQELPGNPGYWSGLLPSQNHGTKVLWYLRAWDLEGYNATRYDPYTNPFSYTVLNRNPEVSITSPAGGEVYKNTVLISWSASDPESDNLTYTLAYNNGGIGWHLIAQGLNEASYAWDITNLPFSNSILIKVIVDDGYGGSSEDVTDFLFTIGEPSIFNENLGENLTFMFMGTGINAALIAVAVIFLRKGRNK